MTYKVVLGCKSNTATDFILLEDAPSSIEDAQTLARSILYTIVGEESIKWVGWVEWNTNPEIVVEGDKEFDISQLIPIKNMVSESYDSWLASST